MWSGLRGSLSLMYSSMHSPGRGVNRVERTLLNFFMRRGVRGGIFRVLEGRFAVDFGTIARCGWGVLPRNSGVFGWRAGAARRFSARRTVPGWLGEKIFKKGVEKGEKPKNWGARGTGRWHGGTLYRACEVIFRRDLYVWRLDLWQCC